MTEIALLTAANLVSDAPDRRADAHLFDIQLDILRRGFAPHGLTLTPVRWIDPLDWPRFDLTLLGMGEDGHTASLFPGSPVDVASPTLAVTANYQGRPANRVTITQNVLNSSRNVFFLVTGKAKAVMLNRVLSDVFTPAELPAQRIAPVDGNLIWVVDEEAGSFL